MSVRQTQLLPVTTNTEILGSRVTYPTESTRSSKFTMSGEDSDCSIELSDFEEDEDDDGVSVIFTSAMDDDDKFDNNSDDSAGFFSDEDQLDENWNKQKGKKGRDTGDTEFIEGKCALCHNLEGVNEVDLEERCQSANADSWCKCGKCRVVSYHMKKYDRVCCQELCGVLDFIQSSDQGQGHNGNDHQCITLHPKFNSDVLEYGALYRIGDQGSGGGAYGGLHTKSRAERERAHSATCSFFRWIWNRLGYGHVMPPACVIARIREVHMTSAPFWYFQNFTPGKVRCEFGKHCVAAIKDTSSIKRGGLN